MTDLITDAMVESAAATLYGERWDDVAESTRIDYRTVAADMLTAAAPLIAAKAWEEGYQACRNRPRVDGYLINRANPYQTRADAIERAES